MTHGDKSSGIVHPITFTYNTNAFGGPVGDNDAVDLAARLLMSYFAANQSEQLLLDIYDSPRDANLKLGKNIVQVVIK